LSLGLEAQQRFPSGIAGLDLALAKDCRWGLLKTDKTTVLPLEHSYLRVEAQTGLITAAQQGEKKYYLWLKQRLQPLDYAQVRSLSGNVLCVQQGGLYGLISPEGQGLAFLRYEALDDLGKGIYRVRIGKRWGLLNAKGEQILALDYEEILPFDQGWILHYKGKYTYFDGKNYSEVFEHFAPPQPGQQYCAVERQGKWGLLGSTGHLLIPPQFERLVVLTDGYFAAGDAQGLTLYRALAQGPSLPKLNNAAWLSPQLFALQEQEQEAWALYNAEAKLLKAELKTWQQDSLTGFWAVQDINGLWGILNDKGQELLPLQHTAVKVLNTQYLALQNTEGLWQLWQVKTAKAQNPAHKALIPYDERHCIAQAETGLYGLWSLERQQWLLQPQWQAIDAQQRSDKAWYRVSNGKAWQWVDAQGQPSCGEPNPRLEP
jgi:hypothetical protein